MATAEKWIDCYLNKPVRVQYVEGNVFSGDNDSNVFGVNVYNADGTPATLSGTVSANFIHTDGTTSSKNGSRSGNKASVSIPASALTSPGTLIVVLKITSSGVVTGLGSIVTNIYSTTYGNTIDPGNIMPSLESLLMELDSVFASIPADYSSLWGTLAPTFVETAENPAGGYVVYNGHLYLLPNGHEANVTWANTTKTQVTIGGKFKEIKDEYVEFKNTCNLEFEEGDGIVYLGEDGSVQRGSSGSILTRSGNLITVTGNDGTSNYFVISGELRRFSGSFDEATPNVSLKGNRTYRFTVIPVSETTYEDNIAFGVFYKDGSTSKNIASGVPSTGGSVEFYVPDDIDVCVVCYEKYSTNPSNYKAVVILRDVTVEKETANLRDFLDTRLENGFHELKYWGSNDNRIALKGSSSWTQYSLIRNRNIYTIDGSNTYGNVIRCKFSGDAFYRVATEASINEAPNDITLKRDHKYRIIMKALSGSMTGGNMTVRFRSSGNDDLVILTEDVPSYITPRANDVPGKFYMYIPNNTVFVNYTFSLLVYDITSNKDYLEYAFRAPSERANILENVVEYWGPDYAYDGFGSGANSIGLIRNETYIKLYGRNNYGYNLRYKVSGDVVRAKTESSVESFEKTIPFIYGHKYKLLVKHLSGEYTGNYIIFHVINESGTDVGLLNTVSGQSGEVTFSWGYANQMGMLYLEFHKLFETTNYEMQVILLDVTGELEGDSELKNRDEIIKIRASRWMCSETVPPVTILHFSDIHGNGTELMNIMNFKSENSELIDSMICTGDMMKASVSSDFTFWSSMPGIENVMVAMGNHDYVTSSSSDSSKSDIPAQIQKWIGDYYENWGVTRPEGASYYYKDYATAKVRLIVLDCNLTGAEGGTDQKTWLADVLADAITNEYAVVIAAHYMYGGASSYNENLVNPFTNVFSQGIEASNSYFWSPTTYISTVQTFIDNGGTFVCWLTGHSHADLLRYVKIGSTVYSDQLNVSITAASPAHDYPLKLTTGDLPREQGTPTESAFNVVTIDTVHKWLKIVRVGANVTTQMTYRDMLCYDYENKTFL